MDQKDIERICRGDRIRFCPTGSTRSVWRTVQWVWPGDHDKPDGFSVRIGGDVRLIRGDRVLGWQPKGFLFSKNKSQISLDKAQTVH